MRVPLEWLREYADIPAEASARQVADALIGAGLEVESVEVMGEGLSGPLLVGRVTGITELTEFKKPIRYCQVDVGEGPTRGIICGASNFAEGDLVAVALPGTTLPGGFEIGARKTYGHVSEGMICSARELGLGEDHDGILLLDEGVPGDDAAAVLGIGAAVLDIAVTPDRGYCLSIRGVAREAATAFGVAFRDPAAAGEGLPTGESPTVVQVIDREACPQYIAVRIDGFDPAAPTPGWMAQRLVAAGMRPISLAVDVTNYVMVDIGQPLHAFDAATVQGGIVVRRAAAGEQLTTLDHVERTLDPEDLLICDDTEAIGMAGVMGGLNSEITDSTDSIVLESAVFAPEVVARTARRHKLPSEASRRFERGIDPVATEVAAQRAAALLVELGGGRVSGVATVGAPRAPQPITIDPQLPARIAGADISDDTARAAWESVGATVAVDDRPWVVTPPSWRPDLRDQADLVEEVVRLVGYENLPATLPSPPAGRGLTHAQRQRRAVGRAMAHAGLVETLCYPFVSPADIESLGINDDRALTVDLANPLSDEAGSLRTTLLPGLLAAARRNLSRGAQGVSLYEIGAVFHPRTQPGAPVRPGVADRPTDDQLRALDAMLPDQPVHVAAVLAGDAEHGTVAWAQGWRDAVTAAQVVAEALHVPLELAAQSDRAPWHPGRCAQLSVDGEVIGYAGELHPRVISALGLPARTAVMELRLDPLMAVAPAAVAAPRVWTFPVAKEDVALIVDEDVPAAELAAALSAGGGELLESVRMFDEYRGAQIPDGQKSLAFALRMRAPDRTLSEAEVAAVRSAAVAAAAERFDAVLRSGE